MIDILCQIDWILEYRADHLKPVYDLLIGVILVTVSVQWPKSFSLEVLNGGSLEPWPISYLEA